MNLNLYFAGLFDGEGCVTIERLPPRRTRGPCYRISVQIAMIDRRPLDLLLSHYKTGGIYKATFGPKALSQAWRWCAVCKQAEKFLKAVRPYLVVKPEEVDLVLDFQKRLSTRRKSLPQNHPLPQEEMDYRESQRLALQAMKKRFRLHQ